MTLAAIAPKSAHAQGGSDASAPSLEQRVADLEAYVNNTARGSDAAGATVSSNNASGGFNLAIIFSRACACFAFDSL